jgi:hypothetical protein
MLMFKMKNFLPKIRITTQDEDNVTVSGIYSEAHFSPQSGEYFGHNVYGYIFTKRVRVLLGTYDKKDAEQIVKEIRKLRPKHYTMPEAVEDEEIMELLEGGD